MAGGVGIYISSSLNAIHRSDLSFNSVEAESCWTEILQEHKPSIIVGCTYRHPSSNVDNFISQLQNLVSPLNQSKHQVFIQVSLYPMTQPTSTLKPAALSENVKA